MTPRFQKTFAVATIFANLVLVSQVGATLYDRGGGLIYDDGLVNVGDLLIGIRILQGRHGHY